MADGANEEIDGMIENHPISKELAEVWAPTLEVRVNLREYNEVWLSDNKWNSEVWAEKIQSKSMLASVQWMKLHHALTKTAKGTNEGSDLQKAAASLLNEDLGKMAKFLFNRMELIENVERTVMHVPSCDSLSMADHIAAQNVVILFESYTQSIMNVIDDLRKQEVELTW